MRSLSREGIILLVVGGMALSAAAVVAWDTPPNGRRESARAFHHITGGLGSGPAVDLAGCPHAFDLRSAGRCPRDLGPLALGSAFCPWHSLPVFSPAPLTARHSR